MHLTRSTVVGNLIFSCSVAYLKSIDTYELPFVVPLFSFSSIPPDTLNCSSSRTGRNVVDLSSVLLSTNPPRPRGVMGVFGLLSRNCQFVSTNPFTRPTPPRRLAASPLST